MDLQACLTARFWIPAMVVAAAIFAGGQNAYADIVRTGGLYVAQPKDQSYRYFIRFFPDGNIKAATSTGTPLEVARWLKPGHQYSAHSYIGLTPTSKANVYDTSGSGIAFTTTTDEAKGDAIVVDYSGDSYGDRIDLRSYGKKTGASENLKFRFVPTDDQRNQEETSKMQEKEMERQKLLKQ